MTRLRRVSTVAFPFLGALGASRVRAGCRQRSSHGGEYSEFDEVNFLTMPERDGTRLLQLKISISGDASFEVTGTA